ncbi:hypothetical protein DCS_05911 [Drechmeria coniospora]|uniref:CFEM domain-containing protein n=1 Tax=Drechmeria coniospora TaxID=98403 RepID=A0A151GA52_DRECN|nr:hypothetical protein DCS_05911 [Drechmeria coniospora]KYK53962.1 hypothetical protein DCS_05911 [Drechmeria coniospora]
MRVCLRAFIPDKRPDCRHPSGCHRESSLAHGDPRPASSVDFPPSTSHHRLASSDGTDGATDVVVIMRSSLLLSLAAVVVVAARAADTATVAASLPPCALTCLTAAVESSKCTVTDLACLCADDALQERVGRCLESSCTLSEALSATNTTKTACDAPVRDRSAQYVETVIPLGVVAIVMTATRLVFMQFFSAARALRPDDWAMAATLVICVAGLVVGVEGLAANGLGRDVWTMTVSEISTFALYFFVMEVLYVVGISLIKLSLSLFYLQIFLGPSIRVLLWATVVFNVLYGVVFTITAIFQCSPVSYFWDQYLPGADGSCININVFGWLNAAIGVLIDLWMIGVPLCQVFRLHMHWKKKVGVAVMFLLGTFVTVVSIFRLHSLIYFAKSSNPTWDQWTTAYWSVIEINVGMICTCLPTFRLILVRLFPTVFGASRSTTSYQQSLACQERSKTRPEEAGAAGLDSHYEAAVTQSVRRSTTRSEA